MRTIRIRLALPGMLVLAGACSSTPPPPAAPPPAPEPTVEERYAALPDTAVCIVDRTTSRGLRDLAAKKSAEGDVVLLVSGAIRNLEELHPVTLAAGYAAREPWVVNGEPITFQGRRYEKVGGERLIRLDQLQRVGEYRAVLVFGDPADASPPRALYVPARPGCVFQAYVRSDLLR